MLVLALLVLGSAVVGRPETGPGGRAPVRTPAVAPAAIPARGETPRRTDAGLARALDRFMTRAVPESPLVGLGGVFVREGRSAGVDPRLLVAIAHQESRLGTTGSGPGARNAFGWGPAIRFASWPAGIRTVARGLRRGYLAQGRDTIAAIAPVWAPAGAPNDRVGMNATWAAAISARYAELGANPWSSVARPLEA
jgi:hypothetical protein